MLKLTRTATQTFFKTQLFPKYKHRMLTKECLNVNIKCYNLSVEIQFNLICRNMFCPTYIDPKKLLKKLKS